MSVGDVYARQMRKKVQGSKPQEIMMLVQKQFLEVRMKGRQRQPYLLLGGRDIRPRVIHVVIVSLDVSAVSIDLERRIIIAKGQRRIILNDDPLAFSIFLMRVSLGQKIQPTEKLSAIYASPIDVLV